MALIVGQLVAKLGMDDSEFQKRLGSSQSGLQKIGGSMRRVGAVATAGMTAPIVAGMAKASMSASDLAESTNAVDVSFGKAADAVQRFTGADAPKTLGMSSAAAKQASADLGGMFSAANLGAKASANLSMGMVKLGADLGSLRNVDPTEMLEKLRSGLAGESEPLRRFGIFLSEDAVKTEAFRSGIAKAGSELTDAQKVQARANIIFRQSADAHGVNVEGMKSTDEMARRVAKSQGDFAKTSDGAANSLRIARAEAENAAASMGEALAPMTAKGATVMATFFRGVSKLPGPMKDVVLGTLGVTAAMGPMLMGIGSIVTIAPKMGPALKPMGGLFMNIGKAAKGLWTVLMANPFILIAAAVAIAVVLIIKHWDKVKRFLIAAWNAIKTVAVAIWNGIKAFFGAVWRAIVNIVRSYINVYRRIVVGVWNAIRAVTRAVWNGIKAVISAVWKVIVALVRGAINTVRSIIVGIWNTIRGVTSNVWNGILNLLRSAWRAIVKAVQGGVGGVLRLVASLPGRILSALGNLGSLLANAGKNLIEGLWNGISSMGSWLRDKFMGLVRAILPGFAEKALGISSPSKVFHRIGQEVMRGLARGLAGGGGDVRKTVGRVLGGMGAPNINVGARGAALAGAGMTGTPRRIWVDLENSKALIEFIDGRARQTVESRRTFEARGSRRRRG